MQNICVAYVSPSHRIHRLALLKRSPAGNALHDCYLANCHSTLRLRNRAFSEVYRLYRNTSGAWLLCVYSALHPPIDRLQLTNAPILRESDKCGTLQSKLCWASFTFCHCIMHCASPFFDESIVEMGLIAFLGGVRNNRMDLAREAPTTYVPTMNTSLGVMSTPTRQYVFSVHFPDAEQQCQ